MARYSDEFKYSIIKRMMPPNNESVNAISKETGLTEGTLYNWKKKARANGIAVPGGEIETEKWSTQDKFLIVVETASLSEIEMAEYCRSKGLFVEQVEAWRDACMQANGGIAQQASKLQKDLRQKERARGNTGIPLPGGFQFSPKGDSPHLRYQLNELKH